MHIDLCLPEQFVTEAFPCASKHVLRAGHLGRGQPCESTVAKLQASSQTPQVTGLSAKDGGVSPMWTWCFLCGPDADVQGLLPPVPRGPASSWTPSFMKCSCEQQGHAGGRDRTCSITRFSEQALTASGHIPLGGVPGCHPDPHGLCHFVCLPRSPRAHGCLFY